MKTDNTKIIDQYLADELSAEQKAAFELKLRDSALLREELELQSSLIEAAKRAVIRMDVKTASRSYFYNKLLKWSLGGLSLLVLAGLIIFNLTDLPKQTPTFDNEYFGQTPTSSETELESVELIPTLNREIFKWKGKDSLYVSRSGVLVSIPRGAFLRENTKYYDDVLIEWQEATDGATIMLAGLSTMADSNLLETQGMFSFRATDSEGNLLDINPEIGVYVQVPVDEFKPGMQLYDGQINEEGIINWVNPVPLEKIPVPVPMSELDFYPRGYEDTLNKLKLSQEKKYRDSLYLACYYFSTTDADEPVKEPGSSNNGEMRLIVTGADSSIAELETAEFSAEMSTEMSEYKYIAPSKVLSFWNSTFDNTIIATRAFEKRMQVIHSLCAEDVLSLYLKNLNEPMYFVDSIIARKGYKQFELFAAERVGRIELGDAHLKKLKAFYDKGVSDLKIQLKQWEKTANEQGKAFNKALVQARIEESIRTFQMHEASIQEETVFNLGMKSNPQNQNREILSASTIIPIRQVTRSIGFRINTNNAIKNVDRLVAQATRARQSFTGKYNNVNIKVRYNSISFRVKNSSDYSIIHAYLLPDKLNSYQRLNAKDGRFTYSLNEKINYSLVIIGISKEDFYYHEVKLVKAQNLGSIDLVTIDEKTVRSKLNQLSSKQSHSSQSLMEELNWLKLEQKKYTYQHSIQENKIFLERMRKVVFPCYQRPKKKPTSETEIIQSSSPETFNYIFPDTESKFIPTDGFRSLMDYIRKNSIYPESVLELGLSGKVIVQYMINANGEVGDVTIIKGLHPLIDSEAIRVIQSIPRFIPAQLNGKNVSSIQTVPISFMYN